MASPFEIEQAVHELLELPYDPATFLVGLGQAFGATDSWAKRVRDGSGAKSSIEDGRGVLWAKKFHGLTCAPGALDSSFPALFNTPTAKRKLNFRYAIATDGQAFKAHDTLTGEVLNCDLAELGREYWFLKGLAGYDDYVLPKESEVDMQASARLRRLYDSLIRANTDWATPERQHDLNKFMTRMIFCLFAEDVGIFPENLFSRTVQERSDDLAQGLDAVLAEVFATMNVPDGKREGMSDWLAAFPYVNGGLFGELAGADSVPMPSFNRAARRYLLDAGSQDWGAINPDIFGSMIQAIVDADERAEGGLHYTSVPNIMKVLGPLFLDDLRAELGAAQSSKPRLLALSQRLGRIRVFDPACGSGNFLVIAYRELREIEMQVFSRLAELTGTEWGTFSNIHLENFYGIEIRDFAAETARLSLYVAQFQMNQRFKENFGFAPKALPLTEMGQIHCGNALRMDWEAVCPPVEAVELDTFICGNPPYAGDKRQTTEQKSDLQLLFSKVTKRWRSFDYVCGFFWLASQYIGKSSKTKANFVSTNSICQGVQAAEFWPVMKGRTRIYFGHQSSKWANLSVSNAGVFCVIIGLCHSVSIQNNKIIDGAISRTVQYISPYLMEGDDLSVKARVTPISKLTPMLLGNFPKDGGHLTVSLNDWKSLSDIEKKFIRKMYGGNDFLSNCARRCIWVEKHEFDEASRSSFFSSRFKAVAENRLQSPKADTRSWASKPYRFVEIRSPKYVNAAVLPIVSSERREFFPVGILPSNAVVNYAFGLYDPEVWELAIISSKTHLAWIATVCGKMKTDYRYSNTLGWNTFPLPELTDLQKDELTARAEEILLVRERHFPKSIAQLYDPEAMPEDLRAAHRRNDEVLERIYIGRPFKNDTERLEHLFKRYAKMVAAEELPNVS